MTTILALMMSAAITVTGPITGYIELEWTPAPAIGEPLTHVLPEIDLYLWLGIAWYWVRSTWLDNKFFGYWLIYQFAVAVLGNLIGSVLGRGSFFRLLERNVPPGRDDRIIEIIPPRDVEQPLTLPLSHKEDV